MIPTDVDIPGATLSEVSAIFLLLVCISMLPFILIFYLKNAGRWEEEQWNKKWGSVLQGVTKK